MKSRTKNAVSSPSYSSIAFSDMVHEIVTLQIGHYSNYVGTQLWNILDTEQTHQNSHIDYQAYYTLNPKTNVSSPRVLIVDYRNTFGQLLDESSNQSMPTNPSVEVIQRPVDPQFWSKQLKTKAKFSPKSLLPMMDYWYTANEEENQFEIYPVGEHLYKTMFHSIEHSLHYLLESCDSLQSFRCLFDVNNSFSGLFASIQDYLTEECPKRPVWSFALGEKTPSSPLNLALALTHSINDNQMPTIPCLNQADPELLALAIHHSLFSPSLSLDLLADRLCPMKASLLNLFWKIPLNLQKKTLHAYLEATTDLFPTKSPLAWHSFLRGIEQKDLYNASLYKFNISNSADLMSTYLREQYGSNMSLSSDSWVEAYPNYRGESISLLTALVNDPQSASATFAQLKTEMSKLSYKVLSKRWEENDFDQTAFEQVITDLETLHEQYDPDQI